MRPTPLASDDAVQGGLSVVAVAEQPVVPSALVRRQVHLRDLDQTIDVVLGLQHVLVADLLVDGADQLDFDLRRCCRLRCDAAVCPDRDRRWVIDSVRLTYLILCDTPIRIFAPILLLLAPKCP